MELLKNFIHIFLHLEESLAFVIQSYGVWTYALLFFIIFCETGLVVTPFLPGDSLLFAAGAFSSMGALKLSSCFFLLTGAAILGDTFNYWIGRLIGPKIFTEKQARYLNRKHLEKTHQFYETYGGKTIIIARFVPIIRTFAPFVAGIGNMTYFKFITYNVIGGILWIAVCLFSGYFFGNLPFVKKHFSMVILVIIFISMIPPLIEILKERRRHSVELKKK